MKIKPSKYKAKAFWECLSCGHQFAKLRAKKPQRVCVQCESSDLTFWASKLEFKRWQELQLLEKAGHIRFLEKQVPFHFKVNNGVIFAYILDFRYLDLETLKYVHEDCKGMETDVFRLKKKLIEAQFGISIILVKK